MAETSVKCFILNANIVIVVDNRNNAKVYVSTQNECMNIIQ